MRALLIFISLTLFISCSNYEEPNCEKPTKDNEEEFFIDETTALSEALLFFDKLEEQNPQIKKAATKRRIVKSMKKVKNNNPNKNNCDYYIFNFENENGFAIVSADLRDSVNVLVSSTSGSIPIGEFCEEGQLSYLKYLIDSYHQKKIEQYNLAQRKKVQRKEKGGDYQMIKQTDTIYSYGPLLQTHWHQRYPFNICRDDSAAMGCVPIAMGQIMAYYNYPADMFDKNNQYHFINWNLINQLDNSMLFPANFSAVSEFIQVIGYEANAVYGQETFVNPINIAPTFAAFDYNCSMLDGFNHSLMLSQLAQDRPILMGGMPLNGNQGHSWVVHGAYKISYSQYCYNEKTGELIENDILEEYNYCDNNEYIIVNWGWAPTPSINETLHYSYEHVSNLYDIPLHVNSVIFSGAGKQYVRDLKMFYNITPKH